MGQWLFGFEVSLVGFALAFIVEMLFENARGGAGGVDRRLK